MTLQQFKKLDTKHCVKRKGFKTRYKIYSIYVNPGYIRDKDVFGISDSAQVCINFYNYKDFVLCLK